MRLMTNVSGKPQLSRIIHGEPFITAFHLEAYFDNGRLLLAPEPAARQKPASLLPVFCHLTARLHDCLTPRRIDVIDV